MAKENPFVENEGQNPRSVDEAYWDSDDDGVLWDAYMMLRDAGYDENEIEPLGEYIERTTIYEKDSLDKLFEEHIRD